jgi:hypothetical protein
MKTPSEPNDPLLQSIAEEAADMPLKAAVEARKTRIRRTQQRRQIAITAVALFCGVCAWQMFPPAERARDLTANVSISPTPLEQGILLVRTEEQARNEPLPLPAGLSKDQENLVKAAQGLPLLLVRDSTGRVARIHVFER